MRPEIPRRTSPYVLDDDVYGLEGAYFGHPVFPGSTWDSGNMFDYTVPFMPNCNMEDAVITDSVWQHGNPDRLKVAEHPEENVLGEIFYNDAVRRLQAVEQLTLPPQYTTIPNTGAFSRFEHIWGSVLFVRQMAEKHGITGKEAVGLQLRTLVSDVAHTFGSHLGDWMFQGVGGAENQHDLELHKYLETVGINDILRRHDFEPKEVIFPDTSDWVEASQPDLCVDRVDYGLREMNRWNHVIQSQAYSAEDFTLTPDGMLAMTDQHRARVFSEGFLLLAQEHWSEPTHRFMLDMLMMRTKQFYGEGRAPRSWVFETLPKLGLIALHDIDPRDLMYVTDPAQEQAYAMPDRPGHMLEVIMTSVARYRRQYVWPGRQERIDNYMMQFADEGSYAKVMASGTYRPIDSEEFGSFRGSFRDDYPPSLPTGFAILDAEEAEATQNEMCIDFPQPPFKTRQIDPLVRSGNGFSRLSELDPSYADRLAEHKQVLQRAMVARLAIADPKSRDIVRSIVDGVEAKWQSRLARSRRMEPDELQSLVSVSARDIFGTYPFMSFRGY